MAKRQKMGGQYAANIGKVWGSGDWGGCGKITSKLREARPVNQRAATQSGKTWSNRFAFASLLYFFPFTDTFVLELIITTGIFSFTSQCTFWKMSVTLLSILFCCLKIFLSDMLHRVSKHLNHHPATPVQDVLFERYVSHIVAKL